MSFTFDTMQRAVAWLGQQITTESHPPEVVEQAHDVCRYLRMVVDGLHDASHDQQDALNRGRQAIAAEYLETCLTKPDADEREMWLRLKKENKR